MAHIHIDICKSRRMCGYFLPLETPKRLLMNHYARRNHNFLTRFPEPIIDKYYWREEYRQNIRVEGGAGCNYRFITEVGQSKRIIQVVPLFKKGLLTALEKRPLS